MWRWPSARPAPSVARMERPVAIIQRMVRPERNRVWTARSWCCIRLAGASPAAVSAGAPRSRPRAARETEPSERGVESPPLAVRLAGGEQVGRPSIKQTLQPRDIRTRKDRWLSRSFHGEGNRLHLEPARCRTPAGYGGGHADRSSVRDRRDPSRRPTLGEGGPYKPMAKGDRAERESEGSIVPPTPAANAGRGKGPCFGRDGEWR